MLLNFTNAKVTKKTRNAIESTTFLCNSYVFRVLYLFRQKAIPPLFLLTKIGANSMKRRSFTDFAPTLHRLWYGGSAKDLPCHYLLNIEDYSSSLFIRL